MNTTTSLSLLTALTLLAGAHVTRAADITNQGSVNITESLIVNSGDTNATVTADTALHVADGDLLVDGNAYISHPDSSSTTLFVGPINRYEKLRLSAWENPDTVSTDSAYYGAFLTYEKANPNWNSTRRLNVGARSWWDGWKGGSEIAFWTAGGDYGVPTWGVIRKRMTITRTGRVVIGDKPFDQHFGTDFLIQSRFNDGFFEAGSYGVRNKRDSVSESDPVVRHYNGNHDVVFDVMADGDAHLDHGSLRVGGTISAASPTADNHVATKGWVQNDAGLAESLGATLEIPPRGDISMGPFTQ